MSCFVLLCLLQFCYILDMHLAQAMDNMGPLGVPGGLPLCPCSVSCGARGWVGRAVSEKRRHAGDWGNSSTRNTHTCTDAKAG